MHTVLERLVEWNGTGRDSAMDERVAQKPLQTARKLALHRLDGRAQTAGAVVTTVFSARTTIQDRILG